MIKATKRSIIQVLNSSSKKLYVPSWDLSPNLQQVYSIFFNRLILYVFFVRPRTSQDQRKKPQRTQLLLCRSRNMHHAFLPQPEPPVVGGSVWGAFAIGSGSQFAKYSWCIGLLTVQRILNLMATICPGVCCMFAFKYVHQPVGQTLQNFAIAWKECKNGSVSCFSRFQTLMGSLCPNNYFVGLVFEKTPHHTSLTYHSRNILTSSYIYHLRPYKLREFLSIH